jgi:hypothetical protein
MATTVGAPLRAGVLADLAGQRAEHIVPVLDGYESPGSPSSAALVAPGKSSSVA